LLKLDIASLNLQVMDMLIIPWNTLFLFDSQDQRKFIAYSVELLVELLRINTYAIF
jgi:hypothetical protein